MREIKNSARDMAMCERERGIIARKKERESKEKNIERERERERDLSCSNDTFPPRVDDGPKVFYFVFVSSSFQRRTRKIRQNGTKRYQRLKKRKIKERKGERERERD